MTKDEVSILLNKYITEELTQSEFETLWATLQHSEYSAAWEKMADEVFNTPAYATISDPAKQHLILTTILKNNTTAGQEAPGLQEKATNPSIEPSVHRVHFLKTAWFRYAALVILSAGAAIWLWSRSVDTASLAIAPYTPVPAHIEAPVNKAMLTMADGTRIELDSTANSSLAKHGIISSDSVIRYSDQSAVATTNTLTTPRAGRYQLVLQDGTRVWLNSASSLKYPSVFTGVNRTVELTGEAYFEVKEASKKPFLVKLDNNVTIQVLGTSFNVMAYKDEEKIQTTLLDGAVKVVNSNGSTLLHPGEQSEINTEGTLTVKKDADIAQVIAWKNGFLVFDNTGLDVIMRRISRNYDVDVIFSGPVTTRHYTGGVRNSANIEQVLRKLELTGGVSFSIEGRKILVKIK